MSSHAPPALPPLAGICSRAEAARPGLTVAETVARLRRLAYVLGRLLDVGAAHIARTPEWEVKCALGYHLWLDGEHASAIRDRIAEMREPPLRLDEPPDVALAAALEDTLHAGDTAELVGAVYGVVRRELVAAIHAHLGEQNPLFDHPTGRVLRIVVREQEEAVAWGERACEAIAADADAGARLDRFAGHVRRMLAAAGGLLGESPRTPPPSRPELRSDGAPYAIDPQPRRDARFRDPFNATAKIDEIYADEGVPADERALALAYKRLREMDVPEWMGPILYAVRSGPWDRRRELARQLWDETRHAMMGETVLEASGVPFSEYPIDMAASASLNAEFTPLEAHLLLWHIEQGLMRGDRGKRFESSVARLHGDPLIVNLQDFDWADEVLHAQIGRRTLPDVVDGRPRAEVAAELDRRWAESLERYAATSSGTWWEGFVARVRAGSQP
jgi:hypothetical protein